MNLDPRDLTAKEIAEIVDTFKNQGRYNQFLENIDYYLGQNAAIMNRNIPKSLGTPDNRVPISYGRRIVNLVTGYMYRPGLVQYTSEDEAYLKNLLDIFDKNDEPVKTEQMGKGSSIQGVSYEYHYIKGDEKGDRVRAVPRFVKMHAYEIIPLYDHEVEPELWGFIRFVKRGDDEIIWVYYDKVWQKYERKGSGNDLNLVEEGVHYYGKVPLAVYRNNEETLGDFEPVQQLIDAYDVLISDSMNEFDRFSWAYLVLKGISLSDEDAMKLKQTRTFENLDDTSQIEFLTKEMATEFIKFMTDLIRGEIHRQSGIPNLEDYDGAGASGKTMSKFIYLMELFTDPKESYFKDGLRQRIDLINSILRLREDTGNVKIIMNRNTPDNSFEQAEIFNKYGPEISWRTKVENFADFVDNPDEEAELMKQEAEERTQFIIGEQIEEPVEDE